MSGLGAWFRDTPESRQMLSEEELKLERDEALARAEAAEAVIEKVRARAVSGKAEDVSDGGYGDGWWDALDVIEALLPEVTP